MTIYIEDKAGAVKIKRVEEEFIGSLISYAVENPALNGWFDGSGNGYIASKGEKMKPRQAFNIADRLNDEIDELIGVTREIDRIKRKFNLDI